MARPSQHIANASYYARHRDAELARVRLRQYARLMTLRILRDRPCADCGARFAPHQMDFDHRDADTRSFRLTSGAAMLAPSAVMAAEVAKCDVVCANCHRVRTQQRLAAGRALPVAGVGNAATERKRRSWRAQALLLDTLRDRPCMDCGHRFPACAMDFDHRDARTKRQGVTRMIGRAGTDTILKEVDKCDIVCVNCHRDRTRRRREGESTERE